MNVKIFVFDVDGTLYDFKSHSILPSTKMALRLLKDKGYKVVIASGRAPYGLGKALNDLEPDYVIGDSGAVLTSSDKVIKRHDFTKEDTLKLIEFAKEYDAGLIFKFIDHMYIYNNPDRVDWLYPQMQSDIGKEPFIYDLKMTHHLVDLPQCASLHAKSELIDKYLKPCTGLDYLPYSQEGFDVVNKGIDKAVGLQDLLNFLNVSADEVMAFGDNFNDLNMMKIVKYPIAMGNAIKEVKDIAYHITESCSDDGIYNALKYLNVI